jgi:hypothetical protein
MGDYFSEPDGILTEKCSKLYLTKHFYRFVKKLFVGRSFLFHEFENLSVLMNDSVY